MPIPMTYKADAWARLPGEGDTAPTVFRDSTKIEPLEIETTPPTVSLFRQMNSTVRGHIIAALAEFAGTFMFLFLGFGAAQVANEKIDTLRPLSQQPGLSLLQISYISAVFGISLGVNVWIFYRVSGGQFNPAVSLGLWLCGAFNWVRLICVVIMQFVGGIAAAGIISALLPGSLQAESSLGSGTTIAQGFFLEAFLTAQLVMTIIMLAVEKSRTSFIAPLAIGMTLFVDHMVGINFTGSSVNPARTLGPAVVNGNYVDEIWIYFVAPPVGAIFAATLYHLLKAMGYQSANPGQDDDGLNTYRILRGSARPVRPERNLTNLSNYNIYLKDLTSPTTRWHQGETQRSMYEQQMV